MKILLIEDDPYKSSYISSFLEKKYKDVIIQIATSFNGAYLCAIEGNFDFFIVDMALPKFEVSPGSIEQPIANGGEILVSALQDAGVNPSFVVMTQYETFGSETKETISSRLEADCGDLFHGIIKYASNSDAWKVELEKVINDVIYTHN